MSGTMDTIIKLNNQTAGRDKLARLLQYSSRAIWHFMQRKEMSHQNVEKFRTLEYTFSSFRKLLRLGKCVDILYGALSTIHYPDVAVRITTTLSRISMSIFLLADHILWVGRTGLCSVNGDRWSRVANKYWLYALMMNLLRDLYEISRILKSHEVGLTDIWCIPLSDGSVVRRKLLSCAREHKDVLVDTLKNACDVLIPMTALGFLKLSPGAIGIVGAVSSVAAIVSLVDPVAKLTPS